MTEDRDPSPVDAVCAALADLGRDSLGAYLALSREGRDRVRALLDLPELRVLEAVPGARGMDAALALSKARAALEVDLPAAALDRLEEGGDALAGMPDARALRREAEAGLAEERLATARAAL